MPDQSVLSDRVKAAMKTALAMVLAYGVALSMDWDNPHWAGFAVAFCSLSTVGESLNKGLLRLSGTLLGGLAALTLIALFPQERWLFLICMSVFIGFCIFMMFGTSRRYFWQVAGLSVPLLALAGGANAPNDFQAVILRTEETALGILSYSLVWLLIWPISTREVFEAAVRRLVTVHRQLTSLYLTSTSGEPHDVEVDALRREATQVLARLGSLLDGAEIDSYETWEARHAWRGLIQQVSQLTGTYERWRQSFPEVRELDGQRLMPELPRLAAELDRRFAEIEHMLDGQPPVSVPLNVEENGVASLSQFHQAALLVYRTHLQAIDTLTRDLFETVASIRNCTRANVVPIRDVVLPLLPSALDPDNLASIARWFTGLWLTVLISLYVPGLPDTVIFIVLTNSILIALCVMPQVPIAVAFLPYVFGSALGSAINVLVMPHLTSFAGLAVVIFAAVFSICWLFSRPTQIVGKMAGLALLLLQMSVKNEQSYSFLDIANFAVASALFFLAVAVSTHFPVSFRPEHVFLRLLRRFFRACAYLASTLEWGPTGALTRWQRLKRAFYLRDVASVPGKLAIWGNALPAAMLGQSTAAQVQALIESLQALAYRMQDLIETREGTQSQVLVRELFSEVRAWRTRLQEILCNLSQQPEAADFADFRAQLDGTLERLEGQIEKAVAGTDQTSISTHENEKSFRLLGVFRGVSEALVNFAKQAREIDWAHLREDRF
jgi:Fusaric acid resistance protein family